MAKPLTIWIPTYRRPAQVVSLLQAIATEGLGEIAEIVVSDNDQGELAACLMPFLESGVIYRRNVANLSAGVNFLRAFEVCSTPWLMIVGDDDCFTVGAAADLLAELETVPADVVAVKFDSGLFGAQPPVCVAGLDAYLCRLPSAHYADAFNNLLLISNWLFRVEPCRPFLSAAYLGYSSKLSHLFPLLQACVFDGGRMVFSTSRPVVHGCCDGGWPKAATWYEMVITLSTFCGFIDRANRRALLRMVLHGDWPRLAAKCLRVGTFYPAFSEGVSPLAVHLHLSLSSRRYAAMLLILLPVLLMPRRWFPRALRQKLGEPGSIERW